MYYIWHDEGCCGDKTDDLEEAHRIARILRDDGHEDVYIADEDQNILPDCCHYCEDLAVAAMPQSTDQGKTIRMFTCCANHRAGWWDGADWDGRLLEVEIGWQAIGKGENFVEETDGSGNRRLRYMDGRIVPLHGDPLADIELPPAAAKAIAKAVDPV